MYLQGAQKHQMWTVGGGGSFWVKENPQTDGEENPNRMNKGLNRIFYKILSSFATHSWMDSSGMIIDRGIKLILSPNGSRRAFLLLHNIHTIRVLKGFAMMNSGGVMRCNTLVVNCTS